MIDVGGSVEVLFGPTGETILLDGGFVVFPQFVRLVIVGELAHLAIFGSFRKIF